MKRLKNEIPYGIGVFIPTTDSLNTNEILNQFRTPLTLIKKSKRKDKERPISEMLFMMFRSCSRDKNKRDFMNNN